MLISLLQHFPLVFVCSERVCYRKRDQESYCSRNPHEQYGYTLYNQECFHENNMARRSCFEFCGRDLEIGQMLFQQGIIHFHFRQNWYKNGSCKNENTIFINKTCTPTLRKWKLPLNSWKQIYTYCAWTQWDQGIVCLTMWVSLSPAMLKFRVFKSITSFCPGLVHISYFCFFFFSILGWKNIKLRNLFW